jgi:hypothetical protein
MAKSLREFAQFVGKPDQPISPRGLVDYLRFKIPDPLSVRDLVITFDQDSRPVALHEIRVVPAQHVVPFDIDMQMGLHDGYIIAVRWRILRGAQQVAEYHVPAGGFSPQTVHKIAEAGTYTVEATISAVGRDGFAEATRSVSVVAQPKPMPQPTPPQPTPTPTPLPQKPSISVSANQSGGVANGAFTVTGSGFLPNTTVNIRVVDDALTTLFFNQSSSASGGLNFVTGKLCQLPGRLHFSANDGRTDHNDLTGTLWSNTVTMMCP